MLGMAYELIIIFLYQSFYGYIYQHIALLITSFMAGLTLGSWLMARTKKNTNTNFILLEVGLIIFSLAILPLFIYLEKIKFSLAFVFFILSIISGFLVGGEFPLANNLYKSQRLTQTAGILYAVDLVGSWIGAISICIVLIPVMGIIQTCLFLAVIKLSSLLLVSRFKT
jgi:spermidine synthase